MRNIVGLIVLMSFSKGAFCTAAESPASDPDLLWPHSDSSVDRFRRLLNLTQQPERRDSQHGFHGNETLRWAIGTHVASAHSLLVKLHCLLAGYAKEFDNTTTQIGDIEQQERVHRVTLDGLNRQRTQIDDTGKSLEISIVLTQNFIRDSREFLTNATLHKIKGSILQAESEFSQLRRKILPLELQFSSVNSEIQATKQRLNETEVLLQQKRNILEQLKSKLRQTLQLVEVLKDFLKILVEFRSKVDVLDTDSRIARFLEPMIRSMGSLRVIGAEPLADLWIPALSDYPNPKGCYKST